jgi:beta-ribofuranosylaminobenzene 5'-phosphate synthase
LKTVQVITGSRLHFGLTRAWSDPQARYTGIGVMIEEPSTVVTVSSAAADNPVDSGRAGEFASQWLAHCGMNDAALPCLRAMTPPVHSGLGSGTQLAQAVAAGLNVFLGRETPDIREVGRVLGRGQRSMTGSHGFALGGLVVSCGRDYPGKSAEMDLADVQRVAVPADWRVLLIRDREGCRVYGEQERAAFGGLVQRDESRAAGLESMIRDDIVPAATNGDFERFAEAVQQYGLMSGEYFREVQGGPYNGEVVASLIGRLRALEAKGVGQSSWGPTVYCWCRDAGAARELAMRIADTLQPRFDMSITRVRNTPASIILSDTASLLEILSVHHVA